MDRHVLVPFDGSDKSIEALEYAVREYPDEKITVLHVIGVDTGPRYGDEGFFAPEEYTERLEQRREKDGRRLLETARDVATDHGVDVDTELEVGRPARTINRFVESHDVDHVVMGSHGRSGPSRVLFGSVAETVTRRSPVPVTIVR